MPSTAKYENLVIGSGGAGKFMAWTMAGAGRRTALVEGGALGGARPNVVCLPSKNIIYCARVISLAKRGAEFGLTTDSMKVDMKTVQRHKRLMLEGLHKLHADRTDASGAELIMGNARFAAPRTVEIGLHDGGRRSISGGSCVSRPWFTRGYARNSWTQGRRTDDACRDSRPRSVTSPSHRAGRRLRAP
jgi:pyruvate/2-oxoglutarate dehydrogenase complex dihydrolipoamide dehydrogenase (E3) component